MTTMQTPPTTARPQPPVGHPRRWAILGVLVTSLFTILIDNTILNVGLKTIQHDLGATQSQMEWVFDSYLLIFAGLMFTAGVLGDRLGRKKVLIAGMVVFGGASVAAAFATTPMALIITRGLMGLGAAMVQPQTLSIIQNVFPPQERAKAIGLWSSFSGIAIAVGPIAGGLLLKWYSWGSLFMVNVPIVLIGLVAAIFVVPESKDPKPSRLDPFGVLLSTGGVIALVYGVIKGGETNDWTATQVLAPGIGGIVLLALFVILQARSKSPALDVKLFTNRHFATGTAALSLASFALMGGLVYMAYYWQAARGYDALKAGLVALPIAAGLMIGAGKSAGLAAKFGRRVVLGLGLGLISVSLGAWAFVDKGTAVWVLLIVALVFGLGMGNVFAPATAQAMQAIPPQKAGAGSAVTNTVRQIAGALGVAVLGSILAASYRHDITPTIEATFPPAAQHAAAESVVGTAVEAEKLVADVDAGRQPTSYYAGLATLRPKAEDSFVDAMHVTSWVAGGFGLAGTLVLLAAIPGRRRAEAEPTAAAKAVATAK